MIYQILLGRKRNSIKVTHKYSFKGYNYIKSISFKTILIGNPAFLFRPSNSEQDINLTDFHYSGPSSKIIMLHILCNPALLFRSSNT